MKVSELGEFGLIKLLSKIASYDYKNRQLLVDLGDDAAAWPGSNSISLGTTDTMVEGIHFTDKATRLELGWKSLAINLSDIAAMGGIPKYALISLALPEDTDVEDVTQLYQGMVEMAKSFHVIIAGGNISTAPLLVITITIFGEALKEGLLTRSAAKPGDSIAVTGYLGSSAAGLKMLTHNMHFDSKTTTYFKKAHLQPEPRIAEGNILVREGVRAAIDISDGFIADLDHICEASAVGAEVRVNDIPVHHMVKSHFPDQALGFALSGGEDYELVFTTAKQNIQNIRKMTDCPITVVGEIISDKLAKVTLIDEKGRSIPWDRKKGWEHFKEQ
jgi:thiamine-monophosphate kinase